MECFHIPEINYARFSDQLHKKVLDERIPINGSFELTFRCNLRCAHCYCNLSANDKDASDKELSTIEVFNILDQIAEAGCLWLLITGGEPLLRPDFFEVYTYAKKKGFIITLFTNGTLITAEIADYLAQWPPFKVEITLYGVTEETYEKVARIPGSFKRCKRGIDLLVERKIPLGLKTMAMTLNKDELWRIKEYAERLGLKFRFDAILNPRLDGSKIPCQFRLSPEEVFELDLTDAKKVKEWRTFCEKFIGPPQSDNLFICGAGVSMFHIDPYGKMSVCEMIRFHNYDLCSGSFQEGWDRSFPKLLSLKPKSDYRCGQCELISLCGQCPGWAQLEYSNQETPVEYLCQIAHLRAEEFYIQGNL